MKVRISLGTPSEPSVLGLLLLEDDLRQMIAAYLESKNCEIQGSYELSVSELCLTLDDTLILKKGTECEYSLRATKPCATT